MRTLDPGEVRGRFCPACGRASGIRRERRTEPYTSGDLAVSAAFGAIGMLSVMFSRTRIRLRCTNCRCQFPDTTGPIETALVWLIVVGIALGAIYGLTKNPLLTAAAGIFALFLSLALLASRIHRHHQNMTKWRKQHDTETHPQQAAPDPPADTLAP